MTLSLRYEHHRDCSPCPNHEGNKCVLIGTGIHEPIDEHLMRAHNYSVDKVDGVRVAARVTGKDDVETLSLVHDGILLFAPKP